MNLWDDEQNTKVMNKEINLILFKVSAVPTLLEWYGSVAKKRKVHKI
jgi:hypothetical protein